MAHENEFAFQDGRNEQISLAYGQYSGRLSNILKKYFPDCPEDVEDTLQDTFYKAYANFEKFNPDGDTQINLLKWLTRIAHNTALDKIRQRGSRPVTEPLLYENGNEKVLPNSEPTPEDATLRLEREMAVHQAIGQLSSEQARLVTLYKHIDGYSISETAQLMGLPEGSIKSTDFRARQALAVMPILQALYEPQVNEEACA